MLRIPAARPGVGERRAAGGDRQDLAVRLAAPLGRRCRRLRFTADAHDRRNRLGDLCRDHCHAQIRLPVRSQKFCSDRSGHAGRGRGDHVGYIQEKDRRWIWVGEPPRP